MGIMKLKWSLPIRCKNVVKSNSIFGPNPLRWLMNRCICLICAYKFISRQCRIILNTAQWAQNLFNIWQVIDFWLNLFSLWIESVTCDNWLGDEKGAGQRIKGISIWTPWMAMVSCLSYPMHLMHTCVFASYTMFKFSSFRQPPAKHCLTTGRQGIKLHCRQNLENF